MKNKLPKMSYRQLCRMIEKDYNIKIVIDNNTAVFGSANVDNKIITINEEIHKMYKGFDCISTLLHELGHILSISNYSNKEKTAKSIAYDKLFNRGKKLTKHQIDIIINEERHAWVLGRKYIKSKVLSSSVFLKNIDFVKMKSIQNYNYIIRKNQKRIPLPYKYNSETGKYEWQK